MQLEQEQLTRPKGTEVCRRRRPEIDLAKVRLMTKHLKPVAIRYSYD